MIRDYTIQSVFVTLHAAVIIGGSMCTATTLKVMGRSDVGPQDNFGFWFVRNWGFLIVVIPLAWAITTIYLERLNNEWSSKRFTVITGLLLLVGLAVFFFSITVHAGTSMIYSTP